MHVIEEICNVGPDAEPKLTLESFQNAAESYACPRAPEISADELPVRELFKVKSVGAPKSLSMKT